MSTAEHERWMRAAILMVLRRLEEIRRQTGGDRDRDFEAELEELERRAISSALAEQEAARKA